MTLMKESVVMQKMGITQKWGWGEVDFEENIEKILENLNI